MKKLSLIVSSLKSIKLKIKSIIFSQVFVLHQYYKKQILKHIIIYELYNFHIIKFFV